MYKLDLQATIADHLKDPRSKPLEPDCLSPLVLNYDTVSGGRGDFTELCLFNYGLLLNLEIR